MREQRSHGYGIPPKESAMLLLSLLDLLEEFR